MQTNKEINPHARTSSIILFFTILGLIIIAAVVAAKDGNKIIKKTENGLVMESGFTITTKYFNGHSFLIFREIWPPGEHTAGDKNVSISTVHDPDCQHVRCKK